MILVEGFWKAKKIWELQAKQSAPKAPSKRPRR